MNQRQTNFKIKKLGLYKNVESVTRTAFQFIHFHDWFIAANE